MSKTLRLQIGAMVIVAALAYIVLQGAHNFSSYFVTVKTYHAKMAKFGRGTVRVQGTMLSKTVHYDPKTGSLHFTLESGGISLPVTYRGAIPNEHFHNAGAIAKGHMGSHGSFEATKLEIQCPDHYAPASGGRL